MVKFDEALSEEFDGVWWDDPWWEGYAGDAEIPLETIQAKIEVLKKHLTPEWLKKAIREKAAPDIVTCLVGYKGLSPLSFMLELSDLFKAFEGNNGFDRKLKELGTKKSQSVLFELDTAILFKKAGDEVRFPKESVDKRPDILAISDGLVYQVECKRLDTQEWERWAQFISMEIIRLTDKHIPNDEWTFNIKLNRKFTDIYKANDPDFIKCFARQLVVEVDKAASEIYKNFDKFKSLRIGEIADIYLIKKSEKSYGSVEGYAISNYAKTKRLIDNAVSRAKLQIDQSSPGIISVYADYRPDPEILRVAFNAYIESRPDQTASLLGIMVFPRLTIFEDEPGYLYVNLRSKWSQEIKDNFHKKYLQSGNLKSINFPEYGILG